MCYAVEARDKVATVELLVVAHCSLKPAASSSFNDAAGAKTATAVKMENFQLHSEVFGEADVSPQFAPFVSVRLEVAMLREVEHRCSGGLYPRFISTSTRPDPPHPHPLSSRRHGDIFIFHKTLMKRRFHNSSNCQSARKSRFQTDIFLQLP